MQTLLFWRKTSFTLLFFLLFSATLSPLQAEEGTKKTLYGGVPGEQFTFNVHWMGIPAGRAEMKMNQAGPGKFDLEAMVETIGMVRFLHSLKDTLRSKGEWLENGGFRSTSYFKDQRKGSQVRQVDYQFDRETKVVTRLRKGEKPIPIKISSIKVNDPLAVFYTLRGLSNLEPGKSLVWITVDGRREYNMQVDIGKPAQRFTPLGRFKIIPIKVKIPSSGELFRQEEAIEIWLTDDERRMPVRVETRLSLGGVAADLVAYRDGRGGHGELGEER
ncbi:MAG: DUF3108 domain-containing protein [Magnetococcales bacterium]|nr:DUF3108 domain-containing protein [Magnetococcales bacterium]